MMSPKPRGTAMCETFGMVAMPTSNGNLDAVFLTEAYRAFPNVICMANIAFKGIAGIAARVRC